MDINKASAEELERVGQIDGERARYLVEHRDRRGPFESWEDVKQVRSFEEGMVERLQDAGFSIQGRGGGSGGGAESRSRASRGREESPSSRQERGERGDAEPQGRAGGERRESHAGARSLNQASADDLERTHMIDGERARRLVGYRERQGPFGSWDDVKNVEGIDDGLVDRLRDAGFGLK